MVEIGIENKKDSSMDDVELLEYNGEETFDDINKEAKWQHKSIIVFGKKVKQPRLTAMYGVDYIYNGTKFKGEPWSPIILDGIVTTSLRWVRNQSLHHCRSGQRENSNLNTMPVVKY